MVIERPKVTDIEVTCGAAPLQAFGHITDGRGFYFRARHRAIELAVGCKGAASDDAVLDDPDTLTLRFDVSAHAGYYPPGEAWSDPHIVSSVDEDHLRSLVELMADILLGHERHIARRAAE